MPEQSPVRVMKWPGVIFVPSPQCGTWMGGKTPQVVEKAKSGSLGRPSISPRSAVRLNSASEALIPGHRRDYAIDWKLG
jgi:hypothetical protein